MSPPFARAYADAYDALYADKDYHAECDLIEEAFRRYGDGAIRSVLDLGCGTGGHAIPLAGRGYELTGVDRSAEMLDHARAKAEQEGLDVRLLEGDVRTVDPGGPFDAALLMFAVLSYQHENEDVCATLRNARRHMRPGGVLVLDSWYGPGVLSDPPTPRTKVVPADGGEIVRRAWPSIDARRHLCRIRYELCRTTSEGECVSQETHVVRYFFPMELELFLELAQLRLVSLSPFGSLDEEPFSEIWNVLVVAEAV